MPTLSLGSIDKVRRWLVERGVIASIVALLRETADKAQLLERACATLANLALFPHAIPFLLRQTVARLEADETEAQSVKTQLAFLREQEEVLVVEEIKLRERIRGRHQGAVRSNLSAGGTAAAVTGGGGGAAEADELLLLEIDKRREVIIQRVENLVFEEEYRQTSRRVPLVDLLGRLCRIANAPTRSRSVRMQAQRLLVNLR